MTGTDTAQTVPWLEYAMPGVQGLKPYQPGKPMAELERELGIRDPIKLASNENPLGPSPKAVAAVQAQLGELARYPDGNGFGLRQALAERHGIEPAGITLGNGSNDVLDLIARVFLGPGRAAVFSAHAFAVYFLVTQAVSAQPKFAPAQPSAAAQPYGHDTEAMLAQLDETVRVVFVANPNNPTGTWLTRTEVERLLAAIPREVIVVLDEAYIEYVDEPDFPDCSTWLHDYPNLIVTRTFSKIYGLAGMRIGYALSSPALADLLNRVRQPFNLNLPAQAAAEAALQDQAHIDQSVRINRDGMAQLTTGLRERGRDFLPSVGNFLCVDCGRPAEPVYEALLREGVIVRPIGGYGLPHHLRVSIGLPEENARFLQALDKVLPA